MRSIEISNGKHQLAASLFEAKAAKAILVISSATGVKQTYYHRFAQFLCDAGVSVITFDYLGIGGSLKKPIKSINTNAESWGKVDLESVLQYVIKQYPDLRKVVLGHSLGGQMIGLAPSATKMNKVILVAAQSGYWKLWSGWGRIRMWFNWHIFLHGLVNLFGYLPSKRLSGMENLPEGMAKQWIAWCKMKDYLFEDPSIEATYYDQIKTNVLSISIADDDFAPLAAVRYLNSRFSNAHLKHNHLSPEDYGLKKIGHFGIFKKWFKEHYWETLLEEIK